VYRTFITDLGEAETRALTEGEHGDDHPDECHEVTDEGNGAVSQRSVRAHVMAMSINAPRIVGESHAHYLQEITEHVSSLVVD
jgi:hypothetical protein